MPVHGPLHHHAGSGHLVEKDVLLEGAKNEEEPPTAQAWMIETAAGSQARMLIEEAAGGFHGIEVAIRNLPTGVEDVPLELPLHVGDENVRLEDAHVGEEFVDSSRVKPGIVPR